MRKNSELIKKIRARYYAGKTTYEISEELNISEFVVVCVLIKAGLIRD